MATQICTDPGGNGEGMLSTCSQLDFFTTPYDPQYAIVTADIDLGYLGPIASLPPA